MSSSYWKQEADKVIRRVIAENPTTTGTELKKLISAAYPFGERKYHPYKCWLERVTMALDCSGAALPVRKASVMPGMEEWARQRGIIV